MVQRPDQARGGHGARRRRRRRVGGTVPAVCWFRRDLRLTDNPALSVALAEAGAGGVVCAFVVDPALAGPSGSPRLAFLDGSLRALDESLGGRLTVLKGDPIVEIPRLCQAAGADAVVVAADHGPYGRDRDRQVAAALEADGRRLIRYGTPYAVAPGTLKNGRGDRFKVFTPFYKAWRHRGWPAPIDPPAGADVAEPPRKSWRLPARPLGTSDALLPDPGEEAAAATLDRFLERVAGYDGDRERPDLDRTSRLSPYLKYGCIHPRQILARLDRGRGPDTFRKELAWREFYADVLAGAPESARQSLQPDMQKMEWDEGREADERFDAWREGRTGYPIVDAGMRQLRAEAWMHNRVRMIVASFLVKDLHLDWRRGASHFMQLLVDGDLASNQHGWQWTAGTGTDPAPFFRVFNPLLQGRKFDPDGEYVRRWVPELSGVTGPDVHEPWSLAAGPPAGYPAPIVDHAAERREALARYAEVRAG